MTVASAEDRAPSTSRVLGVECFSGTLEQASGLVVQAARSGSGGHYCLCNVHVLETARSDPEVMDALRAAHLVFPDGAPIAWLQRRAGVRPSERVAGPDLMASVVREGRALELRHAVYGSTPGTIRRLEHKLRVRYAGARIVSAISPAFGTQLEIDAARDLERLSAAQPDIVWLGLGAPRQELWAAQHAASLHPAIVVTVGAAFDFLAGTKRRAPVWMQNMGLEWLHRAATEPRRLSLRYLTTNSAFLVHAATEIIRGDPGGRA